MVQGQLETITSSWFSDTHSGLLDSTKYGVSERSQEMYRDVFELMRVSHLQQGKCT